MILLHHLFSRSRGPVNFSPISFVVRSSVCVQQQFISFIISFAWCLWSFILVFSQFKCDRLAKRFEVFFRAIFFSIPLFFSSVYIGFYLYTDTIEFIFFRFIILKLIKTKIVRFFCLFWISSRFVKIENLA